MPSKLLQITVKEIVGKKQKLKRDHIISIGCVLYHRYYRHVIYDYIHSRRSKKIVRRQTSRTFYMLITSCVLKASVAYLTHWPMHLQIIARGKLTTKYGNGTQYLRIKCKVLYNVHFWVIPTQLQYCHILIIKSPVWYGTWTVEVDNIKT